MCVTLCVGVGIETGIRVWIVVRIVTGTETEI